jgi:integrase
MGRAPKRQSLFTEREVNALAGKDRPYRLTEPGGLSILVQPWGSKSWQLRYRFFNRKRNGYSENIISLGGYPDVKLKDARILCAKAREALGAGDASAFRRHGRDAAQRSAGSTPKFSQLAEAWLEQGKAQGRWSGRSDVIVAGRLRKYLLPALGDFPVATITNDDIELMMAPIIAAGHADTLERVHIMTREILETAVTQKLLPANPLGKFVPPLPHLATKAKHFASLTRPSEVAPLIRAIRQNKSGLVVGSALQLLPLVFVRPGELQGARWSEFDLERATWIIPAERMKMRHEHQVPLSMQALEILHRLRDVTSDGAYLFPGALDPKRPMSENSVRAALSLCGYKSDKMTPHGFRAMARTMMVEQLGIDPYWIEAQLSHAVPDPLGRAYNRTQFIAQRRKMMQDWADYLDRLAAGLA